MTTKPKIFVTRHIPDSGLQMMQPHCELDIWEGDLPPAPDALRERVRGVSGIVSLLTDNISADVMDAAGDGLRVISQYAVGFNNIDIEAARARDIKVGNTPGVLTDATADLTLALMLAAARQIVPAAQFVHDGKWQTWHPTLFLGKDLHRCTLGIIGLGRIGQAVAKRAAGFGMCLLAYSPSRTQEDAQAIGVELVDLDTLLRESDIVTLHTPLTEATHHMIDARALALMKPDALLVNTARGAVVDQQALVEALQQGIIGAAALDVTDPEPIQMDDPLLNLPNVLVVPHIGSAAQHARQRMSEIVAENLLAALKGEAMPHAVVE